MAEMVLGFPSVILEKYLPGWSGVLTGEETVGGVVDKLLDPDNLFFKDRGEAENDPSFKQVIPYIVVRRDGREILSYQRTKKSGESRLQGKCSIGFGGHINPIDGRGTLSYERCIRRELQEELGIPEDYFAEIPKPVAVLYEAGTPVGLVHFGIVHVIDVPKDFELYAATDESVSNVAWLEALFIHDEFASSSSPFEAWSEMVIKNVVL